MKQKGLLILIAVIVLGASIAASTGIFYTAGDGPREIETVRGTTTATHGYGIYRHMSADVAIQGIAQDFVTLFLGVPMLVIAYLLARRGGTRQRLILAGVLAYFLVTYLFYLAMATYNEFFLVYALLLGSSFFAFTRVLLGVDTAQLPEQFGNRPAQRFGGGFLIINACLIGFLWLSVVIPPLIDGTLYPVSVEHYTTLIVQGFDLGLLLPLSVVTGMLLRRGTPLGLLLGPVYLVFLSLLMTALVAKIVAMGLNGVNIFPAVIVIPAITVISYIGAYRLLSAR